MPKQFLEVQQDDFIKFGGERLNYLEIEDALMTLVLALIALKMK
ncbi:hypothetical protein [Marinomonas ushuaiensis]|nr:hypothetical protein [Marinomonas ushuaiensis]